MPWYLLAALPTLLLAPCPCRYRDISNDPALILASLISKMPMTGSSNDLLESLNTSTRSVITTGPFAAMLMTRNSMLSTPGGPGRMTVAKLLAMFALPATGSSGMLW